MRIGVFHNKPYYLRYYETALASLLERGHELVLAAPDRFEKVKAPPALRDAAGISTALYPHRREDGLDSSVELLRVARDAARYLRPALNDARASRELAVKRLAKLTSTNGADLGEVKSPEAAEALGALFAELERLIPPDDALLSFIRSLELDVLISISRVNIGGPQTDVVKCGVALGLPTGVVVYSWDNLTAGGVLHVQPDLLFVWNEIQVREAAELHGYDPARTVVTGAPRFDPVFERRPSASREAILAGLGLDRGQGTILYLGSSTVVCPDEPRFVTAWAEAVRACGEERLRSANLLVRPHPQTVEKQVWSEWQPPEGVVIAPPVVVSRPQDLFDQLAASDAVVALNTSAEIEAAILDKPVLTIKAGNLAPGQEGQLNFEYLLEERGGFVRAGASLDQHVRQLADSLANDPLAESRARFLRTFVRPRGLDTPAGLVLAEEIERLGGERNGRASRGRIGALLARAGLAGAR